MKAKNILYLITFVCALITVFVCLFFPIFNEYPRCGVFFNIYALFDSDTPVFGHVGNIFFALFLLLLLLGGFALCGLWLFFFIKKKKILPLCVPFIPFSIIRVALMGMYSVGAKLQLQMLGMFMSYYITFAVTAALILIDIVRLALYLKAKYPRQPRTPRPPRPHKPTDKERIAELEKRVQELESKD